MYYKKIFKSKPSHPKMLYIQYYAAVVASGETGMYVES